MNQTPTKQANNPKLNILVGTPAYGCMVHIDYLNSILGCHALGLPITVLTLGNESLITRARNTVISYFYHHNKQNPDNQLTHLLFLDADIKINAKDIARLVEHGESVIGAPVPLKGYNPQTGQNVYNVGNLLGYRKNQFGGSDLALTDKLGTAVFMLDSKAVDALVQEAIEQDFVYSRNPNTRGDSPSDLQYDVFRVGVVPTIDEKSREYLSEDYYVCHTLRRLGFDVVVDQDIRVIHNGNFAFGA